MDSASQAALHRAPPTDVVRDQGGFRAHFDFPGRNLPGQDDHGYGPLATVVESYMDPGTHIRMHPHRNEEIISWVPAGAMRHGDREDNDLVTDSEHLMVMNAGREFWHEELTRDDDPPLRMLQLFVRPHSLGLDPGIQHEPLPEPVDGEWRHLFGPEDADAPLYVRNAVHCYDVRLPDGEAVALPEKPGWHAYFYVFEGAVEAGGERFELNETGLLADDAHLSLRATEDALVVAFLVDPDASVTRQGTIGR